jgi:hypothetical protein
MGLWRRHGRTWTILRKKKKEGRLEWNNMFKTNTLNYFFLFLKICGKTITLYLWD